MEVVSGVVRSLAAAAIASTVGAGCGDAAVQTPTCLAPAAGTYALRVTFLGGEFYRGGSCPATPPLADGTLSVTLADGGMATVDAASGALACAPRVVGGIFASIDCALPVGTLQIDVSGSCAPDAGTTFQVSVVVPFPPEAGVDPGSPRDVMCVESYDAN